MSYILHSPLTLSGRWGICHHLYTGIFDLPQNWWSVAEKHKSVQTKVQPTCNWDTQAGCTCLQCKDSWLLRGTCSRGKWSTGSEAAGMREKAGRASWNTVLLPLRRAVEGQQHPHRYTAGLEDRRGSQLSSAWLSLQQGWETRRKSRKCYPLVCRKGGAGGAKQPRKEKKNIQGLIP